jgi:ankyrin repeat protein
MSSSDSSSDDASDVEITVRQRGKFSANRSPTVGTAERNAAGHIEQNIHASARRSPAETETRTQRPSEEKQHFEKWEMSSSGSAEESSDTSDTESDNEGSQGSTISVTERDIADFMLLVPDYAYSNPDSEASRRFRIGIRSIPSELVDVTDANGNTMFLIACQFACEDLVRITLRRGASAHTINDSGANGLHFACYKDSLSLTIAELLLERRVAVNVPEKLYGCTPLHYAASAGNLALCKLLIASGAYIHAHDYDGCDSVAYAKDAGMWDVVDYLTQELEQQSSIPNTPARTVPRMKLSMPEGIDTAPLPMAPSSGRPGSANHPRVLVNSNSGSMDSFEDVYSAVNTPLSTNRMGGFSRVTSGGDTPMRVSVYDFTPDSPSPSSSKNRKQLSGSAFSALSAPPLPPANGADHTALQEPATAINKSGPTRTPQATLPAASHTGRHQRASAAQPPRCRLHSTRWRLPGATHLIQAPPLGVREVAPVREIRKLASSPRSRLPTSPYRRQLDHSNPAWLLDHSHPIRLTAVVVPTVVAVVGTVPMERQAAREAVTPPTAAVCGTVPTAPHPAASIAELPATPRPCPPPQWASPAPAATTTTATAI